jgi:MFS family permease
MTQALGGIGLSSAIAMAALLAKDVSGSAELAGLAQTAQVLGAAVIAVLLAAYMSRHGRRPGLTLGYLLGALGAGLCILAGTLRAFPLLLLGAVLLGATTAANSQSRYAATDLAQPAHRGRDLSTVVWATTLGSVIGPNLAGPGGVVATWLHLPTRTGPFVFSVVGLLVTAAVMATRLRPDPLLVSRVQPPAAAHGDHGDSGDGTDDAHPDEAHALVSDVTGSSEGLVDDDAGPVQTTRSASTHAASVQAPKVRGAWSLIRTTPLVRAAALGMALTHAVMVSVMVMTPIHMDQGHASLEIIGLVISIHVLGMFALSPLVGLAVDRFGSPPVLAAGGMVSLSALLLAGGSPPGSSLGLGAGLFLLGLGWSLGTVASSTLLTAATPRGRRPEVQGLTDLTTGFTAAVGGAVAGVVLGAAGFGWLNAGASVLALGVVAVAVAAGRHTAQLA